MNNKCKSCGNCCLNTDMLLSEHDINRILKLTDLKPENFLFQNKSGFSQLKNINSHCFFFDKSKKICIIYDNRPLGCRFYPLIYDIDNEQCIFDDDCPRLHLFYRNDRELKRTCQKIKKFITEQLYIDI